MPVFVSKHAIERYQSRIENVSQSEVITRLRKIAQPHVAVSPGEYSVEHRSGGPRCRVVFVTKGGNQLDIKTVFPLDDQHIVRALKNGSWR